MSTGLTAPLYEGKQISFKEFAMRCARGFNFLANMRDEPLDARIPDEFQPSNYHLDSLKVAKKHLAKIEKWSNAQVEKKAKKIYDDAIKSNEENRKEEEEILKNYMAMLKQAIEWTSPSKDHDNLKDFMIKQIVESIREDCLHAPTAPLKLLGSRYRKQSVRNAKEDIAYHTKEYKKEVLRIKERNEWVRALRYSLEDK